MSLRKPTTLVLTSATLLILSAVLQAAASAQRWVVAAADWERTDASIEDGRFDYLYPSDPWEPIGSAAELAGIAHLAFALAVVTLVVAVLPPSASRVVVLLMVAVPSALLGVHALACGLMGSPQPALAWLAGPALLAVLVVQTVGLVWLAILSAARNPAWSIAAGLMIGATPLGYVVAMAFIAPLIVGYTSYDTTPFTESVVAVWPAAAAVALLAGLARYSTSGVGSASAGSLRTLRRRR